MPSVMRKEKREGGRRKGRSGRERLGGRKGCEEGGIGKKKEGRIEGTAKERDKKMEGGRGWEGREVMDEPKTSHLCGW